MQEHYQESWDIRKDDVLVEETMANGGETGIAIVERRRERKLENNVQGIIDGIMRRVHPRKPRG